MRQKALVRAAAVIAAAFLILLALSAALAPVEAENTAAEREAIFQTLLPGGGPYVEEPYSGEDTNISTVYRGTTGYIVETVTAGYAGDITMLVAVDFQGTVVGAGAGYGGDLRPGHGGPLRRGIPVPAGVEPG